MWLKSSLPPHITRNWNDEMNYQQPWALIDSTERFSIMCRETLAMKRKTSREPRFRFLQSFFQLGMWKKYPEGGRKLLRHILPANLQKYDFSFMHSIYEESDVTNAKNQNIQSEANITIPTTLTKIKASPGVCVLMKQSLCLHEWIKTRGQNITGLKASGRPVGPIALIICRARALALSLSPNK